MTYIIFLLYSTSLDHAMLLNHLQLLRDKKTINKNFTSILMENGN